MMLNHGGVGSKIAGGWQINGLVAMYVGSPFTVTSVTTGSCSVRGGAYPISTRIGPTADL